MALALEGNIAKSFMKLTEFATIALPFRGKSESIESSILAWLQVCVPYCVYPIVNNVVEVLDPGWQPQPWRRAPALIMAARISREDVLMPRDVRLNPV